MRTNSKNETIIEQRVKNIPFLGCRGQFLDRSGVGESYAEGTGESNNGSTPPVGMLGSSAALRRQLLGRPLGRGFARSTHSGEQVGLGRRRPNALFGLALVSGVRVVALPALPGLTTVRCHGRLT